MSTQNIYDLTDTWNAAGTTFTAIKMNVTDTASNAASNLMDLQVGGTSRFTIGKTGGFSTTGSAFGIYNNGAQILMGGAGDVILARDAANTLAQRNGTNAQVQHVYATYTDASNYERLKVGYSSSAFRVQAEKAGTGAARSLVLGTNGTDRWTLDGSTGHFLASVDNTYDIGANGANRPRAIYLASTGDAITSAGDIRLASSAQVYWVNRGGIRALSDGVIGLYNNAATDFNRLQFGGTTSSFPALKRNGTAINVRLADDSADAPLTASNLTLAMTTAGTSLDITNSDPGNLGVAIQTRHTSASPAVDDYVGYWNIRGNDSLGNNTLYGYFQCLIVDPTDGSEKGQMYVGAGGGSELRIGQGVHTSGATAPGDVNVIAARQIKTQARTVAQLPAAGTVGAGTRGWVSDSNVAFSTAVITNIVAGGGANGCPVYSDGTNWRIG